MPPICHKEAAETLKVKRSLCSVSCHLTLIFTVNKAERSFTHLLQTLYTLIFLHPRCSWPHTHRLRCHLGEEAAQKQAFLQPQKSRLASSLLSCELLEENVTMCHRDESTGPWVRMAVTQPIRKEVHQSRLKHFNLYVRRANRLTPKGILIKTAAWNGATGLYYRSDAAE